jgi:hypothetical protein
MKLQTSLQLVATLLALGANPASAQMAPMTNDHAPGLIGETYTGAEFGYRHHSDASPKVEHRYGFIVSRPIDQEIRNTDAAFRYNYTRGGANGVISQTHEFAASLLHYAPAGEVKPFLEGQLGWAWSRGATRQSSAVYSAGAGIELLLAPRLAFTPFARFRSAPQFHDDTWE